jgi:hypothetical protein
MRACMLLLATLLSLPTLAAEPAKTQRLDLKAPKIHDVWTPEEIAWVLAGTVDPDRLDTLEVQGFRGTSGPRTPVAWSGIAAPFWALAHPTEAWRIFAPLPPDQAHPVSVSSQPYLAVTAQTPELRNGL